MTLLSLPLGLLLPTLSGWLLLRLLEGTDPLLSRLERLAAGFVIGLTGTMYVTFLVHILGLIRLDRTGFLTIQILLTTLLATFHLLHKQIYRRSEPSCLSAARPASALSGKRWLDGAERRDFTWPPWTRLLLCLLLAWTLLKIVALSITFLMTPLYVDDAIDNWNMRGKLIFHHQELVLGFPGEAPPADGGVFAYPPTVSMTKAWLAHLRGSWSEPLVDSIHPLWFLALLALLFGTIRAIAGTWWGLLGLYITGSMPLLLIHATNPYADVFLAAHIAAAACFLLRALWSPERTASTRFLLLASLPVALLPFTKNEGLVLYFPAFILAFTLALWHLSVRTATLSRSECMRIALWAFLTIAAVLLPWLLFKWMHGFSFGNAKGLPNVLEFSWNPVSLRAIITNTIFEGNWLLLFPLFFGLLVWQWRRVFSFPLLVLSAPFLLAYLLQVALFTFTPLATEAIKQTGYARGIIHLLPLVLLLTILLLHHALSSSPSR